MTPLATWLERLDEATRTADAAEAAIRAEFAHRIALAADERAIAYRRLNFVRGLAETIAPAADAGEAETLGVGSLRARFDWDPDPASPHGQMAALLAPVCRTVWTVSSQPRHAEERPEGASRSTHNGPASLEAPLRSAPQDDERSNSQTEAVVLPEEALATFERTYAERTGSSFWILFDNPMPETPRVDY